jgi:hypothetical protein
VTDRFSLRTYCIAFELPVRLFPESTARCLPSKSKPGPLNRPDSPRSTMAGAITRTRDSRVSVSFPAARQLKHLAVLICGRRDDLVLCSIFSTDVPATCFVIRLLSIDFPSQKLTRFPRLVVPSKTQRLVWIDFLHLLGSPTHISSF